MINTFGQIAQNGVNLELEPSPTPILDNNGKVVSRLVVSIGDGGTGGGASVAPSNIAPGAANINAAATAVTAVAAAAVPARVGGAGTGRISCIIYNAGSNTAYVGPAGVTSASGLPILPGGTAVIDTQAAIYAICAAALTTTLNYLEEY